MITKTGEEIHDKLSKGQEAVAGLAGIGAWGATGIGAGTLVQKALGNIKPGLSDAEAKRLISEMAPGQATRDLTFIESFGRLHNSGIRSALSKDKALKFHNILNDLASHYDPGTHTVMTNKNSYVAAHELGHATGLMDKNRALGTALSAFTHGVSKLAPISEAIKGARQGYAEESGKPEQDSRLLNATLYTGRAASAAQIAEEAQASIRGLRAIGKIQGKAGVLRAAKLLGPAYGTYLAAAAGSHLLAPYLGKLYGKHRARKEQEDASC